MKSWQRNSSENWERAEISRERGQKSRIWCLFMTTKHVSESFAINKQFPMRSEAFTTDLATRRLFFFVGKREILKKWFQINWSMKKKQKNLGGLTETKIWFAIFKASRRVLFLAPVLEKFRIFTPVFSILLKTAQTIVSSSLFETTNESISP